MIRLRVSAVASIAFRYGLEGCGFRPLFGPNAIAGLVRWQRMGPFEALRGPGMGAAARQGRACCEYRQDGDKAER